MLKTLHVVVLFLACVFAETVVSGPRGRDFALWGGAKDGGDGWATTEITEYWVIQSKFRATGAPKQNNYHFLSLASPNQQYAILFEWMAADGRLTASRAECEESWSVTGHLNAYISSPSHQNLNDGEWHTFEIRSGVDTTFEVYVDGDYQTRCTYRYYFEQWRFVPKFISTARYSIHKYGLPGVHYDQATPIDTDGIAPFLDLNTGNTLTTTCSRNDWECVYNHVVPAGDWILPHLDVFESEFEYVNLFHDADANNLPPVRGFATLAPTKAPTSLSPTKAPTTVTDFNIAELTVKMAAMEQELTVKMAAMEQELADLTSNVEQRFTDLPIKPSCRVESA